MIGAAPLPLHISTTANNSDNHYHYSLHETGFLPIPVSGESKMLICIVALGPGHYVFSCPAYFFILFVYAWLISIYFTISIQVVTFEVISTRTQCILILPSFFFILKTSFVIDRRWRRSAMFLFLPFLCRNALVLQTLRPKLKKFWK